MPRSATNSSAPSIVVPSDFDSPAHKHDARQACTQCSLMIVQAVLYGQLMAIALAKP